MKKLFFVLMAVAAIAIVGCEHHVNEPNEKEPPENDRNHNVFLKDTNGANQANRAPMRVPYGQDPYYGSFISR